MQQKTLVFYIVNDKEELRQSIHMVHQWVKNPADATTFISLELAKEHIRDCNLVNVRIAPIIENVQDNKRKKTISGATVNKIMAIAYVLMISFRIAFFFLLATGIFVLIKGHTKDAAIVLLITSIWAGIVEPAFVGAYRYAGKNLDDQAARNEQNNVYEK